MIDHFSVKDLSAIKSLFSMSPLRVYVCNKLYRGYKHGIVNFQLVKVRGYFLIERTYVPNACWKKASKRYISLECFLNEICSHSKIFDSSFIDDLPF